MHARKLIRSALCAGLVPSLMLIASAPAQAYFDHYLSGSIVGTLNQKEAASLKKMVRQALVDTADNTPVEWNYPAEGRRQAIHGTIVPVQSKTDKGQPCRRLKSDLNRGSATESWSGWFCKQSNGQWKARQVSD
ncbi:MULTISPECIES: RT0821/Lpp0805 family surface protein [unclassified Cupriavidus]|uniref:RT0821/Lpp0805 family surface protein n=1 Tax=Cupriavidus sp. H19C3 TaxID=3241603 RepID=UPI003BF86006